MMIPTSAAVEGGDYYNKPYTWALALVAALGGFLFGYDYVVIAGARLFYEQYFELTAAGDKAWANSCFLVGCLAGALISGGLSDKYGRKRLLLLAAVLFTVTSLGTGLAHSFGSFVAWRISAGIAIGLASNLSPMYIAEIAPARVRGKLVAVNQLMIVTGSTVAMLINYWIAEPVAANATDAMIKLSWNGTTGWRWMIIATTAPSVLFWLLLYFVPESPRWLAKNGKDEQARAILARLGGAAYAATAIAEIDDTLKNDVAQVDFRELFEPRLFKLVLLGVGLALLQQFCGMNTIFAYAGEIFQTGKYGVDATLLSIVATGVTSVVFTIISMSIVDHVGRKKLILLGYMGLAITYVVLGRCYVHQASSGVILALLLVAVACFQISVGAITWVILAEIFPNRIRGAAMSVAVFALWAGNFSLVYAFPYLYSYLGLGNTFWMYAGVCLVGFFLLLSQLTETKGKTLEQIERELAD